MAQVRDHGGSKTGDTCTTAGKYRFDSYLDGTSIPPPTMAEREITLKAGEQFPAIRSKPCFWRRSK